MSLYYCWCIKNSKHIAGGGGIILLFIYNLLFVTVPLLSLWFLPPSSLFRSGDRVAFSCWWTCWTTGWQTCTAAPAEPWGTWCTAKLTTTTRLPWRTAEAYRHWSDYSARPQMWRSESCSQVRNKQNIKSNCKYFNGNKRAAGWIWEAVLFRNDLLFLTNPQGTRKCCCVFTYWKVSGAEVSSNYFSCWNWRLTVCFVKKVFHNRSEWSGVQNLWT